MRVHFSGLACPYDVTSVDVIECPGFDIKPMHIRFTRGCFDFIQPDVPVLLLGHAGSRFSIESITCRPVAEGLYVDGIADIPAHRVSHFAGLSIAPIDTYTRFEDGLSVCYDVERLDHIAWCVNPMRPAFPSTRETIRRVAA